MSNYSNQINFYNSFWVTSKQLLLTIRKGGGWGKRNLCHICCDQWIKWYFTKKKPFTHGWKFRSCPPPTTTTKSSYLKMFEKYRGGHRTFHRSVTGQMFKLRWGHRTKWEPLGWGAGWVGGRLVKCDFRSHSGSYQSSAWIQNPCSSRRVWQ